MRVKNVSCAFLFLLIIFSKSSFFGQDESLEILKNDLMTDASDVKDLPLPEFCVDASIAPTVNELPVCEGQESCRVASIKGPSGVQTDFVENELILITDSPEELQSFLVRWEGTVLNKNEANNSETEKISSTYLIKINTNLANTTHLAEDLRSVDKQTTGKYSVSSETGLRLYAAAAAENAHHKLLVSINPLMYPMSFLNRVTHEAHSALPYELGWNSNAFTWPYMDYNSGQHIGVAEAWRALKIANRLTNRVRIAIVDNGLKRTIDTPSGSDFDIGRPSSYPTREGALYQWHGTDVANAAMGITDNYEGAAGPAGPIGIPLLIDCQALDFQRIFQRMERIINGLPPTERPKILNMSLGFFYENNSGTAMLRTAERIISNFRRMGIIFVAPAGNGQNGVGLDVDAGEYSSSTTPQGLWFPCEAPGVLCVGGIEWDTRRMHRNSNFGSDFRSRNSVDMYAPFSVWALDTMAPEGSRATAKRIMGTSFSAPFIAGVLALIWAANPSLSADSVEQILMETAHAGDPRQHEPLRWVNAYSAVTTALGFEPPHNLPPTISILNPRHGESIDVQWPPLTILAVANDPEDSTLSAIRWTLDSTPIGTGSSIPNYRFTRLGQTTLRATVNDAEGLPASAEVTFNVVNTPPTVTITRPSDGIIAYRGLPTLLEGSAIDRNEVLSDDHLTWTSDNPADLPQPVLGSHGTVTFSTNGMRTITFTATDSYGASSTSAVRVTVIDPPVTPLPTVRITAPSNGTAFTTRFFEAPITSSEPFLTIEIAELVVDFQGTATSSDGSPVSVIWYAEWSSNGESIRREIARNTLSFRWNPAGVNSGKGPASAEVTIILVGIGTNSDSVIAQDQIRITITNPRLE